MVMVECTDVGISTISKAAMTRGMSSFVLVAYSNFLGTAILLPIFIFQRNKQALIPFSLLCRLFLIATIGSSALILAYAGIKLSSPTLASAMGNIIPIFTFLLAVIFRMEKLDFERSSTRAKSLGTIVSVCGALLVTLYKGPSVLTTSSPSTFHHHLLLSQQSNWVFGGILLAIACFLAAMWSIVQTATVKEYPEKVTILFFYTFFVAVQSAIFSLIVERDANSWKIRSGIEMTAVASSAIFASVFRVGVHTWCLQKKGPVFPAMFRPLGIAIAQFMGVMFLGEILHLGSVIGSIIIGLGFYAMTWGQIIEKNTFLDSEVHDIESSTRKTPLLQNQ